MLSGHSVARPRQSTQRVARGTEKLQLYLAFGRSTTPIHAKGCASRRKVATFTSRSRARPRQSMWSWLRVTPHSRSRPRQSMARVRALDHANPWKWLRVAPKSCNFTSHSRARPRQSMERVAFPIDGIGAGSGFRKKDRYAET